MVVRMVQAVPRILEEGNDLWIRVGEKSVEEVKGQGLTVEARLFAVTGERGVRNVRAYYVKCSRSSAAVGRAASVRLGDGHE